MRDRMPGKRKKYIEHASHTGRLPNEAPGPLRRSSHGVAWRSDSGIQKTDDVTRASGVRVWSAEGASWADGTPFRSSETVREAIDRERRAGDDVRRPIDVPVRQIDAPIWSIGVLI